MSEESASRKRRYSSIEYPSSTVVNFLVGPEAELFSIDLDKVDLSLRGCCKLFNGSNKFANPERLVLSCYSPQIISAFFNWLYRRELVPPESAYPIWKAQMKSDGLYSGSWIAQSTHHRSFSLSKSEENRPKKRRYWSNVHSTLLEFDGSGDESDSVSSSKETEDDATGAALIKKLPEWDEHDLLDLYLFGTKWQNDELINDIMTLWQINDITKRRPPPPSIVKRIYEECDDEPIQGYVVDAYMRYLDMRNMYLDPCLDQLPLEFWKDLARSSVCSLRYEKLPTIFSDEEYWRKICYYHLHDEDDEKFLRCEEDVKRRRALYEATHASTKPSETESWPER